MTRPRGPRRVGRLGAAAAAGAALAVAVAVLLLLPSSVREHGPPLAGRAASGLAQLIERVGAAHARRFDAKDNVGQPLDTLKVVQAGPPRTYVGVYHAFAGGHYSVRLATTSDLLHFSYAATLAHDASQPSIASTPVGGFVVAWEKRDPDNRSHIQVAGYASLADLLSGRAARTVDLARTLSDRSEGTPSFEIDGPVARSPVTLGLHFYDSRARADRNARADLAASGAVTVRPAHDLNVALARWVHGNIGDRDSVSYQGRLFTVIEGQGRRGDFSSWRLYLYDELTHRVRLLHVHTPAGSMSIGNPALTVLRDPAGHRALFVSVYVFTQGARPGEAGPLIYYSEF